ncbi:universal stress protein [Paenibacillus sp. TAB 01]|uniref:universal stress protein n=1 Tax=Paenibacillus sp. TAB 01 TaxID=3368988 RepID=UPI00375189AE
MFRKIVVAYDGSETAKHALDEAIGIKRIFEDSILEVIHVYQIAAAVLGDALVTNPAIVQNELYEAAEAITEEARQAIVRYPMATARLLEGGPPARVILDYAEANGFELLIVGSRGLGTFKELLLGSVSNEIVQHAKIPVLVVK